MKKIQTKSDYFDVMRMIDNNPETKQRKLASELGFSLEKLNYCLNALKDKGSVKNKNFNSNPKKIGYVYILTTKDIKEKTKLTINFIKRKMKEYDEFKQELKKSRFCF